MTAKGADFSDIQPRDNTGTLNVDFQTIPGSAAGVDTGIVHQITPNNAFRLGQQVFFWLGIANPVVGEGQDESYLTRLRLKLWWARPNMEFRQAFGGNGALGAVGAAPVDRSVFGNGPGGPTLPLPDNRYVWIPSPKRLDITQYQTPPPAASPPQHSDSLLLDDCWTMDLSPPALTEAKFVAPQVVSRWATILYPAMGYALGFTYQAEVSNPAGAAVPIRISLSWAQGTFGSGRIQESVG
jgi:hypothetical protein